MKFYHLIVLYISFSGSFFRHVMLKGVQISVDSRRIVDVVEYTGTIPVIG